MSRQPRAARASTHGTYQRNLALQAGDLKAILKADKAPLSLTRTKVGVIRKDHHIRGGSKASQEYNLEICC